MSKVIDFMQYVKRNLPGEVVEKMARANYLAKKNRPKIGRDKPLNVKPLAEKVVNEIISDIRDSAWLLWKPDGRVRVRVGDIIPATYQQTTIGRRKRFRKELKQRLQEYGWIEGKSYHVYQKVSI
jgi:hypothetical protein